MFKKMFSGLLVAFIILIMNPSVFALFEDGIQNKMFFYGEDGEYTDSFAVGDEIFMSGVCTILKEGGPEYTGYIISEEITLGDSYDTNVGTYTVSKFDFSDVEIIKSAIAGIYKVVIDTDNSGTLTNEDCLSDIVIRVNTNEIASEFTDIAGHEFETYIEDLRLAGVVNGKSEGVFAPDDLLNRAEMTKMAALAFRYSVPEKVDTKPFPDVEIDQWYATYVTVAKTEGIVNGYLDGMFQPANNVNRVEALKIVIETSKLDYAGAETVSFPDTVDDWYTPYLNYAIKYDLADPYSVGADAGLFKPDQFATRGEAAKMISQIMKKVEAVE